MCVPSVFIGSPQTPFPWPGWLCQLSVDINEGGRWPQGALCSSGPSENSWSQSWHVPPQTLDAGGMCAQGRQGICPNRLATCTPGSSPGRWVLSWLRFSLEHSFLLCLLWQLPLPSKRLAHFRLAIIKPILSFSLRNLKKIMSLFFFNIFFFFFFLNTYVPSLLNLPLPPAPSLL